MKAKIFNDVLADVFGLLEYKVRNGSMTYEDTVAFLSMLEANGGIKATVEDLAGFYRQSEDNIRHIIHRSLMPKPKRRVYYDMLSFAKNVPTKWRSTNSHSTD